MTLSDYVQKFAHLSANKNRTTWTAVTTCRALHKPLLLLAVLDLFSQGKGLASLIELNPELSELFTLYWQKIRPASQRSVITYTTMTHATDWPYATCATGHSMRD